MKSNLGKKLTIGLLAAVVAIVATRFIMRANAARDEAHMAQVAAEAEKNNVQKAGAKP